MEISNFLHILAMWNKNNEMEEDLYYVITDKIEKVLKTFGIEGDDAYECSGDIYREIKEYLKK